MIRNRFGLHFIDEDEGTDDTEGWYVVDKQGGALAGPFDSKSEAIEEGRVLIRKANK